MKLILHIGQSKTGTTSLQSCLQANRKKLREQGVVYPDYIKNGLPLDALNHNAFAEELTGKTRYPRLTLDEYFQCFEQQAKAANAHTILLSAESFFGVPHIWKLEEGQDFFEQHRKKIEALKKLVEGYEIHLLCYLRAPEDWFETALTQIIRYEGLFKEHIYESDEQMFELLKPHMQYAKILKMWDKILVPSKTDIIPYERSSLKQGDVIHDFLERTEITMKFLDLPNPDDDENISFDRRYIEVLKGLRDEPRSRYKPVRRAQERITLDCLDELNRQLPEIRKYKVANPLREKVVEFCLPVRRQLSQAYAQKRDAFFEKQAEVERTGIDTPPEEYQEALRAYKNHRQEWGFKFKVLQTSGKAILRNRITPVYALAKNIARPLKYK